MSFSAVTETKDITVLRAKTPEKGRAGLSTEETTGTPGIGDHPPETKVKDLHQETEDQNRERETTQSSFQEDDTMIDQAEDIMREMAESMKGKLRRKIYISISHVSLTNSQRFLQALRKSLLQLQERPK